MEHCYYCCYAIEKYRRLLDLVWSYFSGSLELTPSIITGQSINKQAESDFKNIHN